PFTIVQKQDGSYVFQSAAQMDVYNDLELYLAGMLPPDQVGPNLVPENQTQQVCDGCPVQGTVRTVTINDVISADGPRIPAAAASQKEFRVATVLFTRDRLLSDDEMAFFDYFAARGEATSPLPAAIGLARGATKPFRVATRGAGTLIMSLVVEFPGPAIASVGIFKKAKQIDHLPAGPNSKKFHLELSGSRFLRRAKLLLNGVEADTPCVNSAQLLANLTGGRVPGAGSMTVAVRNSNGLISNVVTIPIAED